MLPIFAVFVLSVGGLGLVAAAVTLATDLVVKEHLDGRIKAGVFLILTAVGTIVTTALAAKQGLVFDQALLSRFEELLVLGVAAYFGLSKPLGVSGNLQANANVPVVSNLVARAAGALAPKPVAVDHEAYLPKQPPPVESVPATVTEGPAAPSAQNPVTLPPEHTGP